MDKREEIVEVMARAHYIKTIEVVTITRPGPPFVPWERLPEEQRRLSFAGARAALSALEQKGYAIVPMKPDDVMEKSGDDYIDRGYRDSRGVYTTMLSAFLDRKDQPR